MKTAGAVRYDGCGLSNIFLVNGAQTRDTPYGKTVAIKDVEGLHKAIANALVDKPAPLDGAEFRFLRRLLDFSQKACGELFDVDQQTIANWEKNDNVDRRADALIRSIVRQANGGDVDVLKLIERINAADREYHRRNLYFNPTRAGWKLQTVANS